MISAITPLVQGEAGVMRWGKALLAYAFGSLAASTLIGSLLGFTGQVLGGPWPWGQYLLLFAALCLCLGEVGLIPRLGTLLQRQTCNHWRFRYGVYRAAFLWGMDIGFGLTTRVNFSSYWILIVAGVLLANAGQSALLLCGYGIGRLALVATGPLLARGQSVMRVGVALLRNPKDWRHLHAWVLLTVGALSMILDRVS